MGELRSIIRSLARRPAFSVAAILTLALGIGANTAIFSVVDAVLVKDLPYADPDRLVFVSERTTGGDPENFSYPDYVDVRAQTRTLAAAALFKSDTMVLGGAAEPRQIAVGMVGRELFRALGAEPAPGRSFRPEEDVPGAGRTVVLGARLWREGFGRDASLVGRTVELDTVPYTVVGIAPESLDLPECVDAWIPLGLFSANAMKSRTGHSMGRMVARLAPGVTRAQAQAELDAIALGINVAARPDTPVGGVIVAPLADHIVGAARPALLLLFAAVGMVLLIACANVAGLLLVRAAEKRHELAVRAALGASRWRLVRFKLVESLVIALGGGLAGTLAAAWGTDVLVAMAPSTLPRLGHVALDGRALLFGLGLSVVSGVVFGLVPAWAATRVDLAEELRGGRGAAGGSPRARRLVVGVEVAATFVLLVVAGLLGESFHRATHVAPGFNADHLFTAKVALPGASYRSGEQVRALTTELERDLAAVPGVSAAALVDIPPLDENYNRMTFVIEGRSRAPADLPDSELTVVTDGYFMTMGIPLVAGRGFGAGDGPDAPGVLIVDQAFVREHDVALGQRVKFGGPTAPWCTIVGIVGSVKQQSLEGTTEPMLYARLVQRPAWNFSIMLRSTVAPAVLATAVAAAVRRLDPRQPIYQVAQVSDLVDKSLAGRRFHTVLLLAFAAAALALAAVGIYGVVAYATAMRGREIAVRRALGAREAHVVALVVGQGLFPVVAGALAGAALAAVAGRLASGLLFGVSALEPLVFAGAAVFLVVAAGLASLAPARRAMKIDPMTSLRSE